MFAVYGIVILCLLGSVAFIYHGIQADAIAKHEQEVKVQQDKKDAIDKAVVAAKNEETGKALVDMDAAYKRGVADGSAHQKAVYKTAEQYVANTPSVQNKQCVIPPAGMAILNNALAQTAADIFGFNDTEAPSVVISPPVTAAPAPAPAPTGRPPKPVPVK